MQKAERRTGADARFVACTATTDNTGLGLVVFGLVDLSPPLAYIFFSHHFDIDLKWAV